MSYPRRQIKSKPPNVQVYLTPKSKPVSDPKSDHYKRDHNDKRNT